MTRRDLLHFVLFFAFIYIFMNSSRITRWIVDYDPVNIEEKKENYKNYDYSNNFKSGFKNTKKDNILISTGSTAIMHYIGDGDR